MSVSTLPSKPMMLPPLVVRDPDPDSMAPPAGAAPGVCVMFKLQVLPAMETAVGATLLALLVVWIIKPRLTVFAPRGSNVSQYRLAVPLMMPVLVPVLSKLSAWTTSE